MSPMVRQPLTLEHGLLGYLQQGPLHGYQIYQLICDPGGLKTVWRLKQAHVYALLARLEEAGYIAGAIQQQEARPAKRVYTITSSGEAAFHRWLETPVDTPRRMRQEFQIKLFFALRGNKESMKNLIHQQLNVCRGWLEAQQSLANQAPETEPFSTLLRQYRRGQIQATITWLENIPID